MAWQKGPHAQAPQGVLCFPTDVAGEVTWDDEGLPAEKLPPPPPDVVAERAHQPKPAPEPVPERSQ